MRSPAVAGQFYDATARGLKRQIEASYRHGVGPGEVPKEPGRWPEGRPLAYVVPHAGYVFSGPVAAHAFLDMAKRGVPDTVVILGPSHHPIAHPLSVSMEPWQTPLGTAEVDADLAQELAGGPVAHADGDFEQEHSLEVEVPFLQHLRPDARIVPLIMLDQSLGAARLVGERLRRLFEAHPDRSVGVLASTDFTHYKTPEVARAQDAFALEAIRRGSAEELDRQVRGRDISMCGPGPTMALLDAMRVKETHLLRYANSADAKVAPMRDVVAYAAIRVA
ncbi:MAG TPA: AmmeMemoRadiSam system protein B [Candidatus Thermoplasmatota archaeon]